MKTQNKQNLSSQSEHGSSRGAGREVAVWAWADLHFLARFTFAPISLSPLLLSESLKESRYSYSSRSRDVVALIFGDPTLKN